SRAPSASSIRTRPPPSAKTAAASSGVARGEISRALASSAQAKARCVLPAPLGPVSASAPPGQARQCVSRLAASRLASATTSVAGERSPMRNSNRLGWRLAILLGGCDPQHWAIGAVGKRNAAPGELSRQLIAVAYVGERNQRSIPRHRLDADLRD